MSDSELKEKLRLIEEAMQKAKEDPNRERTYLDALVDPQDENQCEGCQ
tara:strand:+ start:5064 stop:5207 length:144 start_codon:yes stop_codon:yes gene_type:complete